MENFSDNDKYSDLTQEQLARIKLSKKAAQEHRGYMNELTPEQRALGHATIHILLNETHD